MPHKLGSNKEQINKMEICGPKTSGKPVVDDVTSLVIENKLFY